MKTETTYPGVVKAAREAFKDIYDMSPDDRIVEATDGIEGAIAWLTGLLREAYVAGFQRGVKEGENENVF